MAKPSTKPSTDAAEPVATEPQNIYKNISGVNQHLTIGEESVVVEPNATIALTQKEWHKKYRDSFEFVAEFTGLFADAKDAE